MKEPIFRLSSDPPVSLRLAATDPDRNLVIALLRNGYWNYDALIASCKRVSENVVRDVVAELARMGALDVKDAGSVESIAWSTQGAVTVTLTTPDVHASSHMEPTYQEPELVLVAGPGEGRRRPLGPGTVTIGRSGHSDFAVDLESVSRTHALIVGNADGTFTITDVGGKNGTYVNDVRLSSEPSFLKHGDIIQIGMALFRFLLWSEEVSHALEIPRVALSKPAAYRGYDPYIFLSFAHADRPRAEVVLSRLDHVKALVWYDEGIPGGADWSAVIEDRIQRAHGVCALLTRSSVDSPNVRDEINLALSIGKPFVGVFLEEVPLAHGLRLRLERCQLLRAWDVRVGAAICDALGLLLPQGRGPSFWTKTR